MAVSNNKKWLQRLYIVYSVYTLWACSQPEWSLRCWCSLESVIHKHLHLGCAQYSQSHVLLTTEQMHCSSGGLSTLLKGTLMLVNEGGRGEWCWSQVCIFRQQTDINPISQTWISLGKKVLFFWSTKIDPCCTQSNYSKNNSHQSN